ncbi:Chromatin structure-remodeling complex protein rsc9, partial [Ascosphaera atra]
MGGYDYSARYHAPAAPTGAASTSSADMNGLIPMETVPVDTPANSRGRFSEVAKARGAKNGYSREFDPLDYSALPEKTPRIYDHCIKALESGVPTEVEFALHHLVIISDERGDKFRFCDFPNLAESLIEAAWELSFLVHGVSFEVEYEPLSEDDERLNVLDGCYETPRLVEKIRTLNEREAKERGSSGLELEPVGLSRYERIVKEAVLTFRNMCTLEENAGWVSEIAVFKDLLVYVLNIPEKARSRYVEVVNNVLETAEMVCPFWTFKSDDPAIPGLLDLIKQGHDSGNGGTGDRTQLLLALRIFVLWGMEREDQKKELVIMKEGMTDAVLRALSDYTLLEQDRELLSTTLDFLYQYTAQPGNVAHLVTSLAPMLPITLVPRLTNLLLFEADPILDERVDQEELLAPPPNDIPDVPPSLHAELVRLPEPERCSTWLKTCFTEDEGCEVTQLALWHAYQRTFQHVNQQYHQYHQQQSATPTTTPGTPMSGPMRGMTPQQQQQHLSHPQSSSAQSPLYPPPPPPPAPTLGAAEFINTVSSAFTTAEAQVIRGEVAKFIIRGIRPLEQPINITRAGHPYPRCKWLLSVAPEGTTTTAATVGTGMETRSATRYETRCTRAFDDVKGLKEHLFAEHLNLWRQNGVIDERLPGWHFGGDPQERRPQNVCLWDTCRAFPPPHSQFPSHISYPPDSSQRQQQQPPTTSTL